MEKGGIVPPPFGLGPWDGARVASTAEPYPPPRPTALYRNRTQAKKEPKRVEIRLVVRSKLPGNLRSLPFGPTRCRTVDAAAWPAMAKPSCTTLWVEWPLRRGIRTKINP